MDIYVSSDESGVLDYLHNDNYVFGGTIILGAESLDGWRRRYAKAENDIRNATNQTGELKATSLENKYKYKLFRSLNGCFKFAVIIRQQLLHKIIWNSKKDKQRYLDYAYKIAVKRAFEDLIKKGELNPNDVENINFSIDEHTTATNGRYELREGLEQELKSGTFNYNYLKYFPPLFPGMKSLNVNYCNSAVPKNRMVRAADIIANRVYYLVESGQEEKLGEIPNFHYIYLP